MSDPYALAVLAEVAGGEPPECPVPAAALRLDAPGMPPPGADFLELADTILGPDFRPLPVPPLADPRRKEVLAANRELAADRAAALARLLPVLARDALFDPGFAMPLRVRPGGFVEHARFVSGAYGLVRDPGYGPSRPADVLVVGLGPSEADLETGRPFSGRGDRALVRALREAGATGLVPEPPAGALAGDEGELGGWYFTLLCKHPQIDPAASVYPKRHLKTGLWLLGLELRLVRPRYVLLLGAKVVEAVLGDGRKLGDLAGKVLPLDYGDGTARMMVATHPSAVAKRPEAYASLARSARQFAELARGREPSEFEPGLRHVNLYDPAQLAAVLGELRAAATPHPALPGVDTLALTMDCEWHGTHPGNPGSFLRSIQFTWQAGTGFTIPFRSHTGRPLFAGGVEAAVALLRRSLLEDPTFRPRVGGHYFRADLAWLVPAGLDLRPLYAAPEDPEATRHSGGFDTLTMAKSVREDITGEEGGYGLDALASFHCGVPRYAGALNQWFDRYKKTMKLRAGEVQGYGAAPDWLIFPDNGRLAHSYASYDVDAGHRLFEAYNGADGRPGLLDADPVRGLSGRRAFWLSHLAALGALEMEMTGVAFDQARCEELLRVYNDALAEKLDAFRARIGWPGFNPDSPVHVKEFLFGPDLNGKVTREGESPRQSPPDATLLGLEPVTDTQGKPWARLVRDRVAHKHRPSTGKETLGILRYAHKGSEAGELVGLLRDLRFLRQVVKQLLRAPEDDPATGEWLRDEAGELATDQGFASFVAADGRLRTHFGQVETGRWSSWGPNLQNVSSKREEDYQRILGPLYPYPLRTMLRASDGHVLVECDYQQAELAILAWMSDDPAFKQDIADETDLHARRAVDAFGLDTPANRALVAAAGLPWSFRGDDGKNLLGAIKQGPKRKAAKNVNFGVPYRRGAQAIARQCHEEGNREITDADCQKMIDSFARGYPLSEAFLQACEAASQDPGYLFNAFGRPRRFVRSRDESVVAEQKRSACNFPIQGCVADTVNLAIHRLGRLREAEAGPGRTFRFLLQIHDAILFEVPIGCLEWFHGLVHRGMSDAVDIWPTRPDGTRLAHVVEPCHLKIDFGIYRNWGEPVDRAWGLAQGIPERFLPEEKT